MAEILDMVLISMMPLQT